MEVVQQQVRGHWIPNDTGDVFAVEYHLIVAPTPNDIDDLRALKTASCLSCVDVSRLHKETGADDGRRADSYLWSH